MRQFSVALLIAMLCSIAAGAAAGKSKTKATTRTEPSKDRAYFAAQSRAYHTSLSCRFIPRTRERTSSPIAEAEKQGLRPCRYCVGKTSEELTAAMKATTPDAQAVFTTPKGKVYHASAKCLFLVRSKVIEKATIKDAAGNGRRACRSCVAGARRESATMKSQRSQG